MKNRVSIVACALVVGAFSATASQATVTRSPGSGSHAAPAQRFNAFGNLGHEGSGLVGHKRRAPRASVPAVNVFDGLGHEGSGLPVVPVAVTLSERPWAT